ncbi:uncharacterized protein V1518DRAFT_411881 [Limtongia smithiae]|uniref:uncharacterized protein n=1 Tax=Limtongia smithiae TaxID=1125753 RepID=UPI0034D01581
MVDLASSRRRPWAPDGRDSRPNTKRRKHEISVGGAHPLGVQPLGNLMMRDYESVGRATTMRTEQLGAFAVLSDELVTLLLQELDARSLRQLGYASRVMSAFATQDDLWKQLLVRRGMTPTHWYGTWRRTYYDIVRTEDDAAALRCDGFYSDALYRPFFCSALELSAHIRNSGIGTIPRLDALPTQAEFEQTWAHRPFILTSSAYPSWPRLSLSALAQEYGDTEFVQECVRWKLGVYADYMAHNRDESPLYLFDREFAAKTRIGREYAVPGMFARDYLALMTDTRPDYRWLIIGPERSGSTFHKDPNATCAWNAVVEGEKYWIMFPPEVLPPGVFTSEDESEVTSPLSIAEWFLGFYDAAIAAKGFQDGFCRVGEALYVPSGWWHLVVNLAPTVAITQNFVPLPDVLPVLRFFRFKRDQISGFRRKATSAEGGDDEDENETPEIDVFDAFARILLRLPDTQSSGEVEHVEMTTAALVVPKETKRKIEELVAAQSSGGVSKWEQLLAPATGNGENGGEEEIGFSFGFLEDEDE